MKRPISKVKDKLTPEFKELKILHDRIALLEEAFTAYINLIIKQEGVDYVYNIKNSKYRKIAQELRDNIS